MLTTVKQITLLILLLFFTIPGCHFLSGKKENPSTEDNLTLEDETLDENIEDFTIEEEMDEEDMYEEDIAEDETEEEEEEEEEKDKGFFSWLFSRSDEESEEELTNDFIEGDEDFIEEQEDFSSDSISYEENIEEPITSQTDTLEQAPPQEDTSVKEDDSKEEIQETVKKQISPLNKIITIPYTKAGHTVNAVYIARPNENLTSISQKIYGRNAVDQLLEINTHLRNRSVVVGDKIYYNSPNRPNDTSRLLFYYQDNNITPSYYNLSTGDNIREIASQILGHPKSWKEIWATNPSLESKTTAEKSLSIVYWPQSATTPPPIEPTSNITPDQPQADEKPQPDLTNANQASEDSPQEDLNFQQKPDPAQFEIPTSNNVPPQVEQTKKTKRHYKRAFK